MEYIKEINSALENFKQRDKKIWTVDELYFCISALNKNANYNSFLVSYNRILKQNTIRKITKGIYAFSNYFFFPEEKMAYIVDTLRPFSFNYISMENILSEWSIISQCPMRSWVIMTKGRSNVFWLDNDKWRIEFVHITEEFEDYEKEFYYDEEVGMFKATPERAFKDMLKTKRTTLDLVNLDELEEATSKDFASHYKKISKTYCDEYPFYYGWGAK